MIHFCLYCVNSAGPEGLAKGSLVLSNYDMQWASIRYLRECEAAGLTPGEEKRLQPMPPS